MEDHQQTTSKQDFSNNVLYVFMDESGNFDFSKKGSKYFTMTALSTYCPWEIELIDIYKKKHEILSGERFSNLNREYLENNLSNKFHASEDKQVVRNLFFESFCDLDHIFAHSVFVEKNKLKSDHQSPENFYPLLITSLIDLIFESQKFSSLCIFLDRIPMKSKTNILKKEIYSRIKFNRPEMSFRLFFVESCSNIYLQISDYINWAIFKKLEKCDLRSYELITDLLRRSEIDILI